MSTITLIITLILLYLKIILFKGSDHDSNFKMNKSLLSYGNNCM